VSDRRLLTALLLAVGVPDDLVLPTFGAADKIERMKEDAFVELLRDRIGLPGAVAEAVFELFQLDGLDAIEGRFPGDPAVLAAIAGLRRHGDQMTALGLGGYVEVDLRIVRGLAYYTGIVFEVFDRAGELRAICGGGRYDGLLEKVGGEDLPAVGFGMGDVVLSELLKDRDLVPGAPSAADIGVVFVTPGERGAAAEVAGRLRARGRHVIHALREQPVRKQFQSAGSAGATTVVVLGPDEVARGSAVVRDMASGEEREVSLEDLDGL
jgi:histidyl-tRNA synthetase